MEYPKEFESNQLRYILKRLTDDGFELTKQETTAYDSASYELYKYNDDDTYNKVLILKQGGYCSLLYSVNYTPVQLPNLF